MSLIECLLSMFISVFIFGAVCELFLSVEKNHSLTTALYQLQMNAMLTNSILHHAVEVAGFIGCPKFSADFPFTNQTDLVFDAKHKIIITQNSMQVEYADHANQLLQNMENFSVLQIEDQAALKPTDYLLISDCAHASLFQAEKIIVAGDKQVITSREPLPYLYAKNALVQIVHVTKYYVAKTNREQNGRAIKSLYKKELTHKQELVEGIDKIIFSPEAAGIGMKITGGPSQLKKTWYLYAALPN